MSCKGLFADSKFTVLHTVTSKATPLHSHSEYVVSYYLSGHFECRIGGGGLVEFHQEDTALLNPGEVHQDYASDKPRDYLMINIKKEVFHALTRSQGQTREMPLFLSPKLEPYPPVQRIFKDMIAEVDGYEFGREIVLRSLVNELAVHLIRRFTPSTTQVEQYTLERAKSRYQVRKAIQYLEDNFNKPFNLEELAAASELSKYHLERVFKRATGLTPCTYALMLRIERAKQLLTSTQMPIASIASELGFSHQSHLTNVFKKLTDLTPHVYRVQSK